MSFVKVFVRIEENEMQRLAEQLGEKRGLWAVQRLLNTLLDTPFDLDEELKNRKASKEQWEQACEMACNAKGGRKLALEWLNSELEKEGKPPVRMITLDKRLQEYRKG